MAAEKTIGTVLRKTTGTPMVVADLTSIGEIGIESEEMETTTMDSTGGYREFIPGLKDGGTVPLSGIQKSEANMTAMLALAEAQTVVDWEIEFPGGATWTFSAYVNMWRQTESTTDGLRGFTGSLRVSGQPVYDDGVV